MLVNGLLKSLIKFLVCSLLYATVATSSYGQEKTDTPSPESFKKEVQNFFDEVLDVDIAWDALKIRHISNVGYGVDNVIGRNAALQDTLEFVRQVLQSEFFVRSFLQYDHFWARALNRKGYSPTEGEINRKYNAAYNSDIKFDIIFTPAWDTVAMDPDAARKAGLIAYNVKIVTQAHGAIETRINQEELATLLNSSLQGQQYSNIGNQAKPDVNASLFKGLGLLVGADTLFREDTGNIDRVEFTASSKQLYGFDKFDNQALAGNYNQATLKGQTRYIPWKSVAVSSIDSLRARVVRGNDKQPVNDTLRFRTGGGVPAVSQMNPGAISYSVRTTPAGAEGMESLLATYEVTTKDGSKKEVEAGRVNLVAYNKVIEKLVLVPVNHIGSDISESEVKTVLDSIYRQAVVEWDVSKISSIEVKEIYDDNTFQDEGSGFLSNYTDDMNAAIKALKKNTDIDKQTYYLFLLNRPVSGNKQGSMPLKGQFGFIYTDKARDNAAVPHHSP